MCVYFNIEFEEEFMEIPVIFNRLLIFDGSHALHRALSVPNNYEMITTTGIRTGGIYGTIRTIIKELKTYNYFPVVVFDGSLSKRRLEIYPNYKRTLDKQQLNESLEQKTEEQLFEEQMRIQYNTQRNMLEELLPAFGIPVVHLQDWEGDDIIYILTKMSSNSIVVSDDKDLLQLIRNDNTGKCRVRRAMRDEFWDIDTLKEKGLDINSFIACKAIVGDASDNIPSACFQVGEKTAPDLFKLYEDVCINKGLPYPTTEEELSIRCKDVGISKRKAYLNFNENQFLTNVSLTNLAIIDDEINQNILETIYQDVINNINNIDEDLILKKFNEYQFNTLNDKDLLKTVSNLRKILTETDETVPEINNPFRDSLF